MRTTAYSAFRRNLAATSTALPTMVEETHHLLQSSRNAARLLQATATLDEGGGAERGLTQ